MLAERTVLGVIRDRCSVEEYSKKRVSEKKIDKILEAGIWGPSLHHFQVARYVVVKNKTTMMEICSKLEGIFKKLNLPSYIAIPSLKMLKSASVLIFVFNTKEFSNFSKRIDSHYYDIPEKTEICSIAASVQNMILMAESLEISSGWLLSPIFCSKQIKKILQVEEDLVSVLTLGHSKTKRKRSERKDIKEYIRVVR